MPCQSYIDATGTIEGAPGNEHLAVFYRSFKPAKGTRSIHYMGHLVHDGGGAAVYLRGHIEDRQSAGKRWSGRHHGGLPSGLEIGAEGEGCPSRWVQEVATAVGSRIQDGNLIEG